MIVAGLGVAWFAAVVFGALDGRLRWVGRLALAALAANVALLAVLLGLVLDGGPRRMVTGEWTAGLGIVLEANALGVVFALLSSTVLLVALAFEVAQGPRSRRFPALVLFLATGLTGLFLTADVFSFYVFFELALIASYVLSSSGERVPQIGAAYVFTVVNLLGSFLFLIGIAALYHVTGSLDMAGVADRLADVDASRRMLIAVMFFVAFGVKLGLFPFHFWLPAVYVGVRPAVAAMLSGALANIGAYGLLRFGAGIFPEEVETAAVPLLVIGSASIVYGSLQAISRRDVDEVIAYSAIGQVGYVIVALAVGGSVGLAAAVLYAVVNALNKTLLFLSAGLRGALVAGAFLVGAFSVAGLPPAAGFVGKLVLFQSAVEEHSVALVALIFLGGALSFVYMLQIYQHDRWRERPPGAPSPPATRLVAAAVAAGVLVLGLWPEPLLAVSREAAAVLLPGGRT